MQLIGGAQGSVCVYKFKIPIGDALFYFIREIITTAKNRVFTVVSYKAVFKTAKHR